MLIRTLKYMMVGRTTVANGKTVKVNAVEGKELVDKGYAVEVDNLDKEAEVDEKKPTKAELAKAAKAEKQAKAKADEEAEERAIAAAEDKDKAETDGKAD
ncbi:hypothetical protein [Psychrobacter aquaticus]|uniref:Uncharacterized protein n=1 Tax=Psychrobacter aquaticus CMS 56 TaxID=1354303 RepID=U4T240_9GAMM|nr:hypothetical protein [Psychrobacter aquaticus]ERL54957.1 hypothetical protein M917_2303 [Psychrobacter aquaticus CMS 56]